VIKKNTVAAIAGVLLVIACAILLIFLMSKEDNKTKNAKELRKLQAVQAHPSDVERVFHKGRVVSDAVEEMRKRSSNGEGVENIRKAKRASKVVQYDPLWGEPWDVIVYVFYDEHDQMADFCFGGQ
jgi:hypothetical protein